MEKTNIKMLINDLRAKRDALSLAHSDLKKSSDSWNKIIICLSLLTGGFESTKIQMGWDSDAVKIFPVIMSSIIAGCSSIIKFKGFNEKLETLIQSISLLTNVLNKCRNHKEIDDDILIEYNNALEKLETSLYPDQRGRFLRQSHKNLLAILKYEQKFYNSITSANNGENILIDTDSDTLSSDNIEKLHTELDIEAGIELAETQKKSEEKSEEKV
jgi:hypothetical protein